jgi:hypothetical protein
MILTIKDRNGAICNSQTTALERPDEFTGRAKFWMLSTGKIVGQGTT